MRGALAMMLGYIQGRVIQPLRENQTLLVLCLTTVVVMMGQGIISPVLPLYAQSFGVGVALVGLTISVFGAARLVVNLPAGFLSERWGRRALLVGGPAVTVVASLLSGLAPNLWLLLAFRFLAGAGSAMYMTGAMILLADITSEENRGRLMSLYQGSLLLGVSLGPAAGGFVADAFGLRSPFFLVASLALLATLWSAMRMPETRESVKAEGSGVIAEDAKARVHRPLAATSEGSLWSLLRRPDFLLVCLLTMSVFLTRTGGRLTLVPLVGENRLGLSAGALGAIFTLMSLLNLVTLGPAGTMIDKFGRKAVIVPSALLTAVALMVFAVSNAPWLFVAAAVLHGLGTGLLGPAPAAYAADIAPAGMRGMTMGLYRTAGDTGFLLGPVLLGWVADMSSFGWALGVDALLLFAFAMLFALLAKETLGRSRTVSARMREEVA